VSEPPPVLPTGPDVTAVDADKDGKVEFYVRGKLGEWHQEPLFLYTAEGRSYEGMLHSRQPTQPHRADILSVAGIDAPAILYHIGPPGRFHWISLAFWREGAARPVYGFHYKSELITGTDVAFEPDGTVVVTGSPQEMGGYTWLRRYRVAENLTSDWPPFRATLLDETLTAGPYPTEPGALLTAAFVAQWYNLPADLARYAPDQAVR
jgi:hypothetical protein